MLDLMFKTESFSLKHGNRARMFPLTIFIQQSAGSSSPRNEERKKENKRHSDWKERNKAVFTYNWHDGLHRKC